MSKMTRDAIVNAMKQKGIMDTDSTKLQIVFDNGASIDMISFIEDFLKDNAMLQIISDVREFNEKGGHLINKTPQELSQSDLELKLKLIREESTELMGAATENDLVEERDGFADTIYVLAGYALARGFAGQVSQDWKMVQNSNMSKYCKTEEEARDTVARYKRQLTDCKYQPCADGDGFVVLRVGGHADGKILKSHLYKPVDMTGSVQELN